MTDQAEKLLKEAINKSGNHYLIALLGQEESDYPAQEVHHHKWCKDDFIDAFIITKELLRQKNQQMKSLPQRLV